MRCAEINMSIKMWPNIKSITFSEKLLTLNSSHMFHFLGPFFKSTETMSNNHT